MSVSTQPARASPHFSAGVRVGGGGGLGEGRGGGGSGGAVESDHYTIQATVVIRLGPWNHGRFVLRAALA